MDKKCATYRNFISDKSIITSENIWLSRKPSPTERKWLEAAGWLDFDLVEVHRCGDIFIQFGIKGGAK